jgi:4-amino-4-deoxy-L-arabinose transferase-like glycosyltransferase
MPKKYKLIFWLLAVVLLFFLNGSLLITDSVESNYALTAKEMVLSGDWISPQIYGQYWYDKPIMSYWLISLGFKMFGFTEFGARFFPSLSGLAGLWLIVWFGKKIYSEKIGYLAGAILLTSLQFFTISKSILTDGMLFFFFNAALAFFYLGYSTDKKNYYYGTYAFSALATLTKGPIGFLLPGLIIVLFLLWERNWKELKYAKLFSGTILFFLVAGPWYGIMLNIHPDFYGKFFGTHNFLRATVSEHPRDNVIYYYTAINILASYAWIAVFPATLKNIIYKAGKWVMPEQREKFLLLWVFTIFFFYQNMATKYITYTYPILLPLYLLLASYMVQKGEKLGMKSVLLFNTVIYGILAGVAIYLPGYNPDAMDYSNGIIILLASCTIVMLWTMWKKWRGASCHRTILMVLMVTYIFDLVAVKVLAQPLMFKASAYAAAQYLKQNTDENTQIYTIADYPASAVFYSEKVIMDLIPDEEENKYNPKGFSWSAKNVMPHSTYSEVDHHKKIAVMMHSRFENVLKKALPGVTLHKQQIDGSWEIFTN